MSSARRSRATLYALVALLLAIPVAPAAAASAPAAGASAPTAGPGATGGARPRVAIVELTLAGESSSPAMSMQLQDGFVLALVRAGIDVIDSSDVAKRLATAPELQGCESSPCLKRIGDLLDVPLIIRVKVDNTGNSYKMTARLFSTRGAAPAALPVAAQSRTCDVCTVQEARDQMIRLADGLRPRIEEHSALPALPAPPDGDRRAPHWPAWTAAAAGLVAVAMGALVVRSADGGNQRRAALGGALMGVALPTWVVGLHVAFSPPDGRNGPAGRARQAGGHRPFTVALTLARGF